MRISESEYSELLIKRQPKTAPLKEWMPITRDEKELLEDAIILPFPPSLNMLYPTNKQGRRYTSERGKEFKKAVAEIVENWQVLKGDLEITLKLFRPKKIGDIDNYAKAVLDSLKGYCFEDDKQIQTLHLFRFDDKENPRVEVEIKQK